MKFLAVIFSLFFSCLLSSDDWDEFKVKREMEFKFIQEPKVSKTGDNEFTIEFETSAFCDVTVVIEEKDSKRILRHLASGVLGKNPPVQFQKDSKKQSVKWDAKDDRGEYIRDFSKVSCRVSLGLKPMYDRDLFYSYEKRHGTSSMRFAPTKEGVYVYDGGNSWDYIKLFSHEGDYIRTVYPLSAEQMKKTTGLKMESYPGESGKFPVKQNFLQNSFFLSGTNSHIKEEPELVQGTAHYGMYGKGVTFISANDSTLVAGMGRVHFFGINGASAKKDFYGPLVGHEIPASKKEGKRLIPPLSAALSADGSKIYFTGFHYGKFRATATEGLTYNGDWDSVHGVKVFDVASGKMSTFVGNDEIEKIGNDNQSFNTPIYVSVDAQGRVYVADHLNHRVQIYDDKGKYLKTIQVERPGYVAVLPDSKQIAVMSFGIETRLPKTEGKKKWDLPTKLILFKSFDNPQKVSEHELPKKYNTSPYGYLYNGDGLKMSVAVVEKKNEIFVWACEEKERETKLNTGKGGSSNAVIFKLKGKSLNLEKDFNEVAKKDLVTLSNLAYGRWRIYVNPKNGKLYLPKSMFGYVGKAFKEIIEIDTKTNKQKMLETHFCAEDMAFDPDGFLYLKSIDVLARFDLESGKEVPFDYGEERQASTSSFSDRKVGGVISSVSLPFASGWHHGGIFVTAKGDIVACGPYTDSEEDKSEGDLFQNYAGRRKHSKTSHLVHVFDKHGKEVQLDVVKGLSDVYGIGMDEKLNIYMMSGATKIYNGKSYHNIWAGTVIKIPKAGAKAITTSSKVPMPLTDADKPKREADVAVGGAKYWIDNAEWYYGGVGFAGKNAGTGCACFNARMAFDYLNRSFAPELERYRVAVIDSAGNLICHIGQYGNADSKGPKSEGKLGGDEVAMIHGAYLATHTDNDLYISDPGNNRILKVKLNYHENKVVPISEK